MHNVDKITVGAWGSIILSFMTHTLPYLQYAAVVLGIVASIYSIAYHRRKRRAN